ncbi:hypothetical protein B1A90_06985 [Neisseria meningitidis]|nr:hypothetical protein B1A90_06985 [Neisseria meningitidis]
MVLGEYYAVAGHIGFGGKADARHMGNDPRRALVHPPFLPDFGQHIFFHRALEPENRWKRMAGRLRTSAARAFCRQ